MEVTRKWKAILRLGELRDQRAVLTLIAVLEGKLFPKSFSQRQRLRLQTASAESLGKIGGTLALSKLKGLLNSQDPKERSLALSGYSVLAGGQAVADLLTALKTETDATIKAMIISALGNAGKDLSMQEKQSIATELIRQMENNPKGAVHSAAINALGKLRLKIATEPLLKQLVKWHSGDPAADIVRALGEIRDQKGVNLVVAMLETHVKSGVRSEAALALGKIGGAKALAALKRRLNQEKEASVKADISKAMTAFIHLPFRAVP
jgi:HEAT repeat protein